MGNASGCQLIYLQLGTLDSNDVYNLLNAGVSVADLMNCGNVSGCSVAYAISYGGSLSSYEINSLLDAGVSVADIMDCGYA